MNKQTPVEKNLKRERKNENDFGQIRRRCKGLNTTINKLY
jgi:hypothetical protein